MRRAARAVRILLARALISLLAATAFVPVAARAVERGASAGIAKPAAGGAPWTSAQIAQLTADIDALLATAPAMRGAHIGVLAVDTLRGDVLYARNPDDAFVPASTMKLLTGSVALATLGPNYRSRTVAYLSDPPSAGGLLVVGGGDPLLTASNVAALARAARAAGVRSVPYLDTRSFEAAPYPPGWSWDDFGYDYAAKLSPLPVDENTVTLTFAPGTSAGDPLKLVTPAVLVGPSVQPEHCRGSGAAAALDTSATVTTPAGTESRLDVARAADGCLAVSGSLPAGAKPETVAVAVADPRAYLQELFARAFTADRGAASALLLRPDQSSPAATVDEITSGSNPPPTGRLVWSNAGEPLSDLLADMWWPSDNFVAEMLLRTIGLQAGGAPGTTAHGVDAERAWLVGIGVDPATLTIVDGSGLSTYDRLTPRALVAILQADWNGPNRDTVLDDLPLAGVRGTLRTRFANSLAEKRTFAKTGSVSHARGLAGYLAPLHHGAVTFAWSVDDWMSGSDDDLDRLRAAVLSRVIGDGPPAR